MAEKRSTHAYLEDLFTSIDRIEEYIAGITKDEMTSDYRILDGVERNLEKISEATRQGIPHALQVTEPSIPWRQILAIGNVLRHDYQKVDSDILWDTVTNGLPPYKEALKRIRELVLKNIDTSPQARDRD